MKYKNQLEAGESQRSPLNTKRFRWVCEDRHCNRIEDSGAWFHLTGRITPTIEERMEYIHPFDRDNTRGTIARAVRLESKFKVRFRVLDKGGVFRHIVVLGYPKFRLGELSAWYGTLIVDADIDCGHGHHLELCVCSVLTSGN